MFNVPPADDVVVVAVSCAVGEGLTAAADPVELPPPPFCGLVLVLLDDDEPVVLLLGSELRALLLPLLDGAQYLCFLT